MAQGGPTTAPSQSRPNQLPLRLPSASSAAEPESLSTVIQIALPQPNHRRDLPRQRYVRAVLARYLWLPDTPLKTSRHDRRVAKTLFDGNVSLLVVEGALLLAVVRRTLRSPDQLAPVRSLHYFLPVVAELLELPQLPSTDYFYGLLRKLQPLAELKAAQLATNRGRR